MDAQDLTKPAIRLKVTGLCNRSCTFCHEEGDMRTIDAVRADRELFECLEELAKALGIERLMLTGGEPTIHPEISEIIQGATFPHVSMTTNGICPIEDVQWRLWHDAGLTNVAFSIHDATVQRFLALETWPRRPGWGLMALQSQFENVRNALLAGIPSRVNIVVYAGEEEALRVVERLISTPDISKEHLEIRFLNDLSAIETSGRAMGRLQTMLDGQLVRQERRAGTSNLTHYFQGHDGLQFSMKRSDRYFVEAVCGGCALKLSCHEGFYGVRVEKRSGQYHVRLCIYKHGHDVVMPWQDFLDSPLVNNLRDVIK